ncbi:hypothetical protein N0V88_002809 [Collariella sp. IMI 366227]|nr:hypothetical protein N0V88_002809 [Collariella sp. IMI 366227]
MPVPLLTLRCRDAVDTLVAHGADIDDDIGFGYTPLFDACLFQKYQMAAELIDRGANVNVEFSKARGGLYQPDIYWSTVQGFRPIDCCVRRHSDDFKYLGDFFSELVSDNAMFDIVRELVKHGASVNEADEYGVTPLAAVFAYDWGCCPFHPRLDSWPDDPESHFQSDTPWSDILCDPDLDPLEGGCSDLRACATFLIQNGADVNKADTYGNTPLGEEPKWRVPDTITYVDSRRWPRTPLEHAFWDCDFDAVEGFLEAGSTPDQSTILWMVQLLLESTEGESTPSIRRGFEVLKKLLPKSVPDARCLYLALRENNLDLAQQLWDLRSDLAHALLTAVEKGNLKTIETLVKHGAKVHIRDDDAEYLRCWKSVDGCVNPVRLAIRQPNTPSIEVMLNCSTEPLTPWFRYFYLNEAYTTFNPAVVACLLRHPGMHLQQAGIDGGTDLSLAHLVRDVEKICAKGHQWDWNDGPGSFGPRLRMKQADEWMECLAEFADAGVDPTLRDSAGKSALDYLEEYMNYTGKNRFKNYLASRLRSAGGAVEGENLDAAACYGALKSFYIGSVEF